MFDIYPTLTFSALTTRLLPKASANQFFVSCHLFGRKPNFPIEKKYERLKKTNSYVSDGLSKAMPMSQSGKIMEIGQDLSG